MDKRFLCGVLLACSLPVSAFADDESKHLDLSLIEVTPHELALAQVLSEVCPPLLTPVQQEKFAAAHQAHLQSFMPNLDVTEAINQMEKLRSYRMIVKDVRKWTLSFPAEENRALCVEFVETGT